MQSATETITQAAAALEDSTTALKTKVAQTSCVQSNRGGVVCEQCAMRNYINDQACKLLVICAVSFFAPYLMFKVLDWLFPL